MCGRRKMDTDYPDKINYGDMDFDLLEEISWQVPDGIMVQFHWNGEPTLYPRLGDALSLFDNCTRQFDTNGKLLLEKAQQIIDNLEVLTISVIQDENNLETRIQKDCLEGFLALKNERSPRMVYRLLGKVDRTYWDKLPGTVVTRTLHNPMMSNQYEKPITIPEHGICQDFLNHLAIDRFGKVSPCVRFDPHGLGIIGDLSKEPLKDIWNGKTRQFQKKMHIEGRRDVLNLCSMCDYYGVPIG